MKANEAPEKIYLNPLLMEDGESIVRRCTFERQRNSQIEYTRTDAFIEKAKEWFIEHVNIPQDVATNEDGEPLAGSYIKYAKARFDAANEMFEKFKNYMKGEQDETS